MVRTVDGGKSWLDVTPPGGEHLTFRDIEAFDSNQALVLTTGLAGASRIYQTDDGGDNWDLVFKNRNPEANYDGIAFFDRNHGIALSDPVGGKFRILTTDDGGRTWRVASTSGMPPALPAEVARATGTCLITNGPQDAWFGTQPDGASSRVFHTRDRGHIWSAVTTPIPGAPDFGIASLAFWDTQRGLILGGGAPGTDSPSVVAATADGGATWSRLGSLTGFRVNMALIPTHNRDTAVAVGLTGSDITTDGGQTWYQFDQTDLRGVSCQRNAGCWAVGKDFIAAELMSPIFGRDADDWDRDEAPGSAERRWNRRRRRSDRRARGSSGNG